MLLLRLSYSRNAVAERSGGGQISGRSYDVAVNIEGRDFVDFEMLDAKIAIASKRIISNQYFRRRV